MNAVLCRTTDVELNTYELPVQDDAYSTLPLAAIVPAPQPLDEEMLHTSFEEAISDRVLALHGRLSRLNTRPHPYLSNKEHGGRWSLLRRSWRRGMVCGCLALMFTLIGFDLMGLLILHMH